MRKITFDSLGAAISAVEGFADGLGCNVTITQEAGGTYMFFGRGEKVATWICGDGEDDLPFYGINRESNPTSGHLVTGKT